MKTNLGQQQSLLLCEPVVLLRTERRHRPSSDSHHKHTSTQAHKHSRTACNRPCTEQQSTCHTSSRTAVYIIYTLVPTRVRQQEQADKTKVSPRATPCMHVSYIRASPPRFIAVVLFFEHRATKPTRLLFFSRSTADIQPCGGPPSINRRNTVYLFRIEYPWV